MAKALFKSVAMNKQQAKACMRHNKRETKTDSIKAVEHKVRESNEELVYETYESLEELIFSMPNKPHGNAKFFREAVLTLEQRHTLKDLEELGLKIHEQLGYTPMYFFIHRDEGHIQKHSGRFITNLHAHMGYTTLDFKTGRVFRHGREEMQALQKLTADILEMEQGVPVSESGRIGLGHREWRVLKDKESEIENLQGLLSEAKAKLQRQKDSINYYENALENPLEYYLNQLNYGAATSNTPDVKSLYLRGHLNCVAKLHLIIKTIESESFDDSTSGGMNNMQRMAKVFEDVSGASDQQKSEKLHCQPTIGKWEGHYSLSEKRNVKRHTALKAVDANNQSQNSTT